MAEEWSSIGVVVVRRRLSGPWAAHEWLPGAILSPPPDVPSWTRLQAEGDRETFYAGSVALAFHSGETSHYRDNLQSPRAQVWVQLRPTLGPEGDERVDLVTATVDPYEGEALADSMGDVLVAVPMPPELEERLGAFFAAHHVEREFYKRQRKRVDPDALARRGRVDRPLSEDEP